MRHYHPLERFSGVGFRHCWYTGIVTPLFPTTEFHTVAGSDHGFGSREREDEDEAIAVTVSWLSRQYGS